MTITPLELLDTSIAQLQTLVTFLDDQLGWAESVAQETRACKEIARSLRLLIQSHKAHDGNCVAERRTTFAAQLRSGASSADLKRPWRHVGE